MDGLLIAIFVFMLANVAAVVALLLLSRRLERTLQANMKRTIDLLELRE